MAADLYADWLGISNPKRPPNHFALLGLSLDEDNPEVIEQAAREQAQKIRERVEPSTAEAAKTLMQEVARARAVLLDPAKRSAYRAAMKAAAASAPAAGAEPWWKQEVLQGPNKPAPAASTPRPAPMPQTAQPAGSEFEEIDDGIRRRRKKSPMPVALLLVGGGGILLAVAGGVAAFLIFANSPSTTSEQAKQHSPTSGQLPIVKIDDTPHVGPDSVKPTVTNPPIKSTFAARPEPPANESPRPNAPKTFKRHPSLVQGLAISPRDHRLLSAGEGGVIEWQIGADGSFVRHGFKNPALGCAYLPDGKHILCADEGSVLVIELLSNEIKNTLKNPRGNLQCLALDPDGKHVVTGSSDGSIHWWDVNGEKPAKTIELGESVIVASVAVSPDGRFVAAGSNDGTVGVWELATSKKLWRTPHHKGMATAVAFTPDGSRVISGGIDGAVAMWNLQPEGKAVNLPGRHNDGALCLAFLHKGTGLISGGGDKTLKVWNYESGHLLRTLPMSEAVHTLAIPSHDGFVVCAGKGGMVQLTPMPAVDVEVIAKEDPPEKKLGKPSAAEQAEAQKALRDKYKTQLARAKDDDLAVLADRWLARAGSSAEPPDRWALFHASIDTFVKLGKPASALKAITELDRWFEVDELAESSQALTGLVKTADAAGQKEIVDAGLKLFPKIDAESRADLAAPIMDAVTQAAQKSGAADLVKRVATVAKEREQAIKAKGRLAELEAKLKMTPDDPAANLEYGLMLGAEDKWADALTHIAKGGDQNLAKLAQRDLAEPKDAKGRAELGYAWADAAEKHREGKVALLARAKFRLEQAESGLTGEERSKLTLTLGRVSAELRDLKPTKPKDPAVAGVGNPPAGGGTKPASPPKPGEVRRNKFNTLNGETVFKANWVTSGKTRWEAGGLRIQDGGGGIESKFLLVDNWQVDVIWDPDSRTGAIEINGQSIAMPVGMRPSRLLIQRNGKKLTYQRAISSTRMSEPTVLELSGDNLAPSRLKFLVDGENRSTLQPDGTLVRALIIDGRTRPVEEEKKDEKKESK